LYDSMFTAGAPATLQLRPYSMDEISVSLATNDPQAWVARLALRSTIPG
jgi:hypothetical protein